MKKDTNIIGTEFVMNSGKTIKIISRLDNKKCSIVFIESGEIRENVFLCNLKKGTVKETINRVGEIFKMKKGGELEIISHNNYQNYTVLFDNGFIKTNVNFQLIEKGTVFNPYYLSLYGVGYLGEGIYSNMACSRSWRDMFARCYREAELKRYPTYKGCSVDPMWHCYQDFILWYRKTYNPENMKGWHLDKDILFKGNKVYSPNTCCFVPAEINILFTKTNSKRGHLPIGVFKSNKRFGAGLSINGARVYLGTFNTIEEAFQAYKIAKEKHIKEVAEIWKDKVTSQTYQALMNYKVEITD